MNEKYLWMGYKINNPLVAKRVHIVFSRMNDL